MEENAQLTQPSLLDLPVEVFQNNICSFLDATTLVHGLRPVCKQFYLNLKDDLLWKSRINRIWPNASRTLLLPARPDNLFWMSSCVGIEKTALWQQQDSLQKVTIEPRLGYIDTPILLMHINGITYIITATHHHLLCHKLFPREKLIPSLEEYKVKTCVKDDFLRINDLMAIDHTIYTCSCNKINSWVLNTGLVHQKTYEINLDNIDEVNILLCMASCSRGALFATGSHSGKVFLFDSRDESNKPIMQYQSHTLSVNNLAMNTEYILSCSRLYNTVSVWDQRARKIVKSIAVPDEAFPSCMSMQRNWVCVGDHKDKLHMLDPNNDFKLVKSYSTEHTAMLPGVRLTHGCLITSSLDGTVRISSLTDPPKPITTFHLGERKSVFSMDYLNDTLAIAGDNKIVVWCPK